VPDEAVGICAWPGPHSERRRRYQRRRQSPCSRVGVVNGNWFKRLEDDFDLKRREIEFGDDIGDCYGTVLRNIGVDLSECGRLEEVDDCLKLLNGWLTRPGRRLCRVNY
jgi:hypothetical protein